jgi:RNA polymerase-binding transcription factor DksA
VTEEQTEKFYQKLLDTHLALEQGYADQVKHLRMENAELRKTIANFPADATAMQDRITMLELMLAEKI